MGRTKSRYALLLGTLHRSPKAAVTSLAAIGVWSHCMSYCADNETDGFVPAAVVEGYCRKDGRRWRKLLAEMVEPKVTGTSGDPTPWLHRTEHGYSIHDYTNENITKQQADDLRSTEADRKAAYRDQQKQGVASDVPPGRGSGHSPGQCQGHLTGLPAGPLTQDTGHKTQDLKRDDHRGREAIRTSEGIAQVFTTAARASAVRAGHLTPGLMFPHAAHTAEYGLIAAGCEELGDRWPDFIGWWWRPGGWADRARSMASPKALLKGWQASIAEWRDPNAFAASRRPDKKPGPHVASANTDYETGGKVFL